MGRVSSGARLKVVIEYYCCYDRKKEGTMKKFLLRFENIMYSKETSVNAWLITSIQILNGFILLFLFKSISN